MSTVKEESIELLQNFLNELINELSMASAGKAFHNLVEDIKKRN